MDDLTFRRRIYQDPSDNSNDIKKACEQDSKKAKFKAEVQQFDKLLQSTLNVEVPENLSDRILLAQTIDFQKQQKQKFRWHIAMAASIVFTVGISFQIFNGPNNYNSFSEHALAHVYSEEEHLHDNENYSSEDLNDKLAEFGASISSSLAPVTFASFCRFDGIKSLHLVLQGEHSPVTVFLLPKEVEFGGKSEFWDQRFNGKVSQFERANMVIMTEGIEDNEKWQQKISSSLKWQKS